MHLHSVSRRPHPEDLTRVTALFKALSEPVRVQLVLLLEDGERTVGQLVEALELPQSTVSRHLGLLRSSNVVKTRRTGTSMHYRLADAHMAQLVREAFSHAQHERLNLPDHPLAQALTGDAR